MRHRYGDASLANINVNFPKNGANSISIAVQCVQVLPAQSPAAPSTPRDLNPRALSIPVPWRVQMLSARQSGSPLHHTLPCFTCPVPLPPPPMRCAILAQEIFFVLESNLVVVLALEMALGLQPTECCGPPHWRPPRLIRKGASSGRAGVPPWLGRLVLRTIFMASQARPGPCSIAAMPIHQAEATSKLLRSPPS